MEIRENLTQRQYINFIRALKRLQPEEWESIGDLHVDVYLDLVSQAAISAEWTDMTLEEFDALSPVDGAKFGEQVHNVYMELRVPDPNL